MSGVYFSPNHKQIIVFYSVQYEGRLHSSSPMHMTHTGMWFSGGATTLYAYICTYHHVTGQFRAILHSKKSSVHMYIRGGCAQLTFCAYRRSDATVGIMHTLLDP